jgi:MFS family permease
MTTDKKQFLVILLIVFLGFVGISMPYLIFPSLFMNPAYSFLSQTSTEASRSIYLGVTLAAYPLGQFIGAPILGALSDDYGRKPLLAGSILICALCNLFTGIAIAWHFLGLLIFSRFLAGLMEGNIAIARAMASNLKTISKQETFGKINAVASMAYLLGPLLGGLLSDKNLLEQLTPATPFYFTCLLFFFLAGLSSLVLQKSVPSSKKERHTIWQRLNLPKRLTAIFANKQLQFLIITSTILTLAVDIFYEFGPVYLTVKWALSPAQLTIYNGILCCTLAIGNGYLPTFAATRISNRQAILYSSGVLAACLFAMAITNSPPMMMTLFALCGLAISLSVTLITVKISDCAVPTIQGEVMGVQISMRVLGDAIICLFGGALLLISPKIILILAAFMCLASMAYYRTLKNA